MAWFGDSDRALSRAAKARDKEYWRDEERKSAKHDRALERAAKYEKEDREFKYFTDCASEILSNNAKEFENTWGTKIAEALRYIHDSQLSSRWFEEECVRNDLQGGKAVFREKYFHAFLIENLKACVHELIDDLSRGERKAKMENRDLNVPYFLYRRALYHAFEFLDIPKFKLGADLVQRTDQWHEIHDEIRGFGNGFTPKPPIYNLAPTQILEAAKKRDPRIDVQNTVIAGPNRELRHVTNLAEPVRKESAPSPPPARHKAIA